MKNKSKFLDITSFISIVLKSAVTEELEIWILRIRNKEEKFDITHKWQNQLPIPTFSWYI